MRRLCGRYRMASTLFGINSGLQIEKLQIAAGSDWENCVTVRRGAAFADIGEIDKICGGEIGIEAFPEASEAGGAELLFCGARLSASAESIAALHGLVDEFLKNESFTLEDFKSFLESRHGQSFFCGEPDFMELGLLNRWKSYGGLVFWKKYDGTSPLQSFAEKLKACGRFHGKLPALPAVEFGYGTPLPHWIGCSAGDAADDGSREFRLNVLKAAKLLGPLG